MKAIRANVDGKQETLACTHWKMFPPVGPSVQEEHLKDLYQSQQISANRLSELQVFFRVCGLQVMEPSKCLSCPHVRKVVSHKYMPHLAKLDGSELQPLVDAEQQQFLNRIPARRTEYG